MDRSHALLLVNTVACYVMARKLAKKGDVDDRKPFEHIEAVILMLALIALVLFVFPQDLGLVPQLVLPISVAVYGLFMSRVPWVTQGTGKILSIVMFAVVAAAAWGYTMYTSLEGQLTAVATLVAVGAALGTYFGMSKLEGNNSAIGVGVAFVYASFTNKTILSQFMFYIGLSMLVTGLALKSAKAAPPVTKQVTVTVTPPGGTSLPGGSPSVQQFPDNCKKTFKKCVDDNGGLTNVTGLTVCGNNMQTCSLGANAPRITDTNIFTTVYNSVGAVTRAAPAPAPPSRPRQPDEATSDHTAAKAAHPDPPPAPTPAHVAAAPVEAPADTPASSTAPVPQTLPVPNTGTAVKKGFVAGVGDPTATAKIHSLNTAWYYTWGAVPPVPAPPGILFTPMVWNIAKVKNVTQVISSMQTLNVAGQENVVLAYNEPDGTNANAQGNMTVGQAVQYWPSIAATKRRLGSPVMYGSLLHPAATAGNNTPAPTGVTTPITVDISNVPGVPNNVLLDPGIWLDNFLIQISRLTPKPNFPDFIAIHWYGPPNSASFLNYLTSVNKKYNLPLWITEYSCADWGCTFANGQNVHTAGIDWSYPTDANISTNATAVFMRQTVAGMEAMPFVERYSWKERYLLVPPGSSTPGDTPMSASNPDVMGQSTLFASYQHFPTTLPPLTPLGKLYASL
jgi:hypothetical protein